jgi:hypothetical protein
MYIALLDSPFNVATPPVPYPFPSPLGPLAWLQGVPRSLSTPLASSLCAAAPSRSIWRLFGSTRARVSPGLRLAPALWLGYAFPLRAECLFVFQPHLLMKPPHLLEDCLPTGLSPCLRGGDLFVWATPKMSPPGALAAAACAAAQHSPGARAYEPLQPLSQDAVLAPSPPPPEGVPTPCLCSAAAIGSGPKGHALSAPS